MKLHPFQGELYQKIHCTGKMKYTTGWIDTRIKNRGEENCSWTETGINLGSYTLNSSMKLEALVHDPSTT